MEWILCKKQIDKDFLALKKDDYRDIVGDLLYSRWPAE